MTKRNSQKILVDTINRSCTKSYTNLTNNYQHNNNAYATQAAIFQSRNQTAIILMINVFSTNATRSKQAKSPTPAEPASKQLHGETKI